MRARFFVALTLALTVLPAAAQTPPALPAGAEAVEAKLMTKVGPQTRAWIRQTAASQRGSTTLTEASVTEMAKTYSVLGGMNDNDIMALAYLVMMEATKSANEDLKSIMEGVKQINSAKDGLRQTNARAKAATAGLRSGTQSQAAVQPRPPQNVARVAIQPVPVPKPQFDARLAAVKANPDSLNEMGEMESLRLQMAMDRMSKFMTTLSNLQKKMSDTGATITQNLK